MSAMIETAIWLAIRSRIEALPLGYDIAWPAEKFTPPFSGAKLLPYIRVGRVSADPVRRFIDNGQAYERTGSVIVTLVAPLLTGSSISFYDQVAGTIGDHFKDTTQMSYSGVCVSVPSYPSVQEGYEDNGYWTVPVVIPWRCFA